MKLDDENCLCGRCSYSKDYGCEVFRTIVDTQKLLRRVLRNVDIVVALYVERCANFRGEKLEGSR